MHNEHVWLYYRFKAFLARKFAGPMAVLMAEAAANFESDAQAVCRPELSETMPVYRSHLRQYRQKTAVGKKAVVSMLHPIHQRRENR